MRATDVEDLLLREATADRHTEIGIAKAISHQTMTVEAAAKVEIEGRAEAEADTSAEIGHPTMEGPQAERSS